MNCLQSSKITQLDIFNELDYGPDEAKTEEEVIARIGQGAIDDWNKFAKVPDGWIFDPQKAIQNWFDFANKVEKENFGGTVLVVTSNGIARFAPYLTGDFEGFDKDNKIKVSTRALCFFEKEKDDEYWKIEGWNLKPKDFL